MQIHPVWRRPLQVDEGIDDQLAGAVVGHFSSTFDAVDGRGGKRGLDGEEAVHVGLIGGGVSILVKELIRAPFERVHVEARGIRPAIPAMQPPSGVGASVGLTGEEGEVFFRRAAAEGVDRLVFEQEEVVSIVGIGRRTALRRRSAKAAETVMQENMLVGPSHFIGNGGQREGAADMAGGALMWLVCGRRSRRWLFSNTFLNIIFSGSVEKLLMAFSWHADGGEAVD